MPRPDMTVIRILALLALLVPGAGLRAEAPPTRDQLIRYHHHRLGEARHRWFHGEHLVALARLAEPAVVPVLIDELEDESFRFRLIALWGLARIDTPRAKIRTAAHQPGIRQRLLMGSAEEIAFRSAFLARVNRTPAGLRRLNAALPTLYNTARGAERLDQRLLAAWVLYQIDTPVTVETAERAMADAAGSFTFDQARILWNLVLIRLLGEAGERHFREPLERILATEDFFWDLARNREAILRTLTSMSYPRAHPAMTAALAQIETELHQVIGRAWALGQLAALLPHGCRPALRRRVREIYRSEEPDDPEWRDARAIIRGCEAALGQSSIGTSPSG